MAISTKPRASKARRERINSHTSGRTALRFGFGEPLEVSFGAEAIVAIRYYAGGARCSFHSRYRKRKGPAAPGLSASSLRLNVVIQSELVGMWAQTNCVHFFRALVVDIGAQQ